MNCINNSSNKVIRILHVINGLGTGGAERIIMEWYRNIDRKKFQFDFLIRSEENIYLEEIKRLGGNVYRAPEFPNKWIKNFHYTKELLSKKDYKIVHVHGNALIYIYPLIVAKKNGIPCRIMHSHNTHAANFLYYPVHWLNKLRIKKLANINLACSKAAGKWMFGKEIGYILLKNGIEVEKFKFQKEVRDIYRKKMKLEDKFVIGNVARFLPAKNHSFLLRVFKEVVRQEKNAVLLLIGEGKEQEKIIKKAKQMNLLSKIYFMGTRSDVNKLMQAMDIFVLPSKFEGLPIVLVEAQFAGLPSLASDNITKETGISKLLDFFNLKKSPKAWADKILSYKEKERDEEYLSHIDYDYDISSVVKKLEEVYSNNLKRVDL